MLNKKYIIIGIVVVVLIVVFILFSRNDSSTPDSSVLEKGVKNLTRESAAEMIEIYYQVNPYGGNYGGKIKEFSYNEQLGHHSPNYGEDEIKLIKALAEAGMVKIVEEKRTNWGTLYLSFDFTDQAKPYFFEQKDTPPETKNITLLLGELVSVEVTGLTEPAVEQGVNRRYANYTAKYKATPIGQIIDEKKASEEVKDRMSFVLYDDGWRIGY